MKQNWEIKKLAEVVEFHRGLTYSKNDEVEFSENIVLRSNNIDLATNSLDLTELKYINKKVVVPKSKKVKRGTLLICTANGSKQHLGKVALIKEDLNYAFGGFMGLLNPHKVLYPDYLYYLMKSDSYKRFINELSDGANINNLKFSDLGKFEVPLPAISEQKRIVAILDKAFAAIDKAKANTEKNLQNVRELFESYLRAVISDEGSLEMKTLPQISKVFGRGKSKHRPRNWEGLYGGKYPFIQTGDIRNSDHFINEYSQTYNEVGLAQSKLWPTGTICITIAANIAETGVLTFDACFPDSVIGIVVDEKLADRDFVEYLLQSYKVRLQSLGKGSAQDNINLGTFENELFPFPTVQKQRTIVKKLNKLSEDCNSLQRIYEIKEESFEEIRKAILQKAFSGKLN